MPQPTFQQVHVQAALTQIATAYLQDARYYVADQVFPLVPVEHQADKYFRFSKDDFFRDQAQERADAAESAGGGFNLDTASYSANVWAFHKDLGAQVVTLHDKNIADALIRYAQQENISHVVFGQSVRSRWDILLRGSVLNRFLAEVRDVTVQVVPVQKLARRG